MIDNDLRTSADEVIFVASAVFVRQLDLANEKKMQQILKRQLERVESEGD